MVVYQPPHLGCSNVIERQDMDCTVFDTQVTDSRCAGSAMSSKAQLPGPSKDKNKAWKPKWMERHKQKHDKNEKNQDVKATSIGVFTCGANISPRPLPSSLTIGRGPGEGHQRATNYASLG